MFHMQGPAQLAGQPELGEVAPGGLVAAGSWRGEVGAVAGLERQAERQALSRLRRKTAQDRGRRAGTVESKGGMPTGRESSLCGLV